MAETTGWGGGGWSGPQINVQNTTKDYLSQLHPLVQMGAHALEGAYPGYINNTLTAYHNFATPQGQWNQVQNERGGFNAAATDQGNQVANQAADQGAGQTLQNALRLASSQQGAAAGNSYQSQMGSQQGQMAANQYGNQLLGNLTNGPANQAYQQNLQDFNQRMQINNTAPQQQGFFGSLVGAAAPLLGAFSPKPAAQPAPQPNLQVNPYGYGENGGGYGPSWNPATGGYDPYTNPLTGLMGGD